MSSRSRLFRRTAVSGILVAAVVFAVPGVASATEKSSDSGVKVNQKINAPGVGTNQSIRIDGGSICIDQNVNALHASKKQKIRINANDNCDVNVHVVNNDKKKDEKKYEDKKEVKKEETKVVSSVQQPTVIPLTPKAATPAAPSKAPVAAAAAPAAPTKLAFTGSNTETLAGVAMVLVALGMLMLFFTGAANRTKSLFRSITSLRSRK